MDGGYTSELLITEGLIHEFDVARWLTGSEVVGVTVHALRASSAAPEGTSDPMFVVLEAANGVLIDVEVFISARYRYDIPCEEGTVSLATAANTTVRQDSKAYAPDRDDLV